jgi:hypothetical protein
MRLSKIDEYFKIEDAVELQLDQESLTIIYEALHQYLSQDYDYDTLETANLLVEQLDDTVYDRINHEETDDND